MGKRQIAKSKARLEAERQLRLVARGVLVPPKKKRRSTRPWPQPPGKISDEVMAQVLWEEREGR
jgi:hypothetical protein